MALFKIYKTKQSRKWVLRCNDHDSREEVSSFEEALRIMPIHFQWWHTTTIRVVGEPRVPRL